MTCGASAAPVRVKRTGRGECFSDDGPGARQDAAASLESRSSTRWRLGREIQRKSVTEIAFHAEIGLLRIGVHEVLRLGITEWLERQRERERGMLYD